MKYCISAFISMFILLNYSVAQTALDTLQIQKEWCGRWEGKRILDNKGHYVVYIEQYYSDFRGTAYCHEFSINAGREVDSEKSFHFTWAIEGNTLVRVFEDGLTSVDINSYRANLPKWEIERDIRNFTYQTTHTEKRKYTHKYKNKSTNTVELVVSNRDGVYVPFTRSCYEDPTNYLFRNTVEGTNFIPDRTKRNDCLIRGAYQNADSTLTIGLFKRGMELQLLLGTKYGRDGRLIEEIKDCNIDNKSLEVEMRNNRILADKFVTPVSGKSKYTYADGSTYEGDWHNHLPEGEGLRLCRNGDRYEGTWYQGILKKGNVKVAKYEDKGKYEGEFSNGHPFGHGCLDNGKYTIEGEYIAGKPNGTMTKTYTDKCVFKGSLNDRFYELDGKMEYPDSSTYVGTWKDLHWVHGIYTRPKEFIYEGDFDSFHQFEGEGKYTDLKTRTTITGQWEENKIVVGDVLLIPSDTTTYACYQGNASNSSITGEGTLKLACGYSIRTVWNNGLFDGEAIVIFSNGDEVTGTWMNGELVKDTPVTYKWTDGLECRAVAGNKSKISKKTYFQDNAPMKSKVAKNHVTQYTSAEGEYFRLTNECRILNNLLVVPYKLPLENH